MKKTEVEKAPHERRYYPENPGNPITLLKQMKREYDRFPALREEVKGIESAIWHLTKSGWTADREVKPKDES